MGFGRLAFTGKRKANNEESIQNVKLGGFHRRVSENVAKTPI